MREERADRDLSAAFDQPVGVDGSSADARRDLLRERRLAGAQKPISAR